MAKDGLPARYIGASVGSLIFGPVAALAIGAFVEDATAPSRGPVGLLLAALVIWLVHVAVLAGVGRRWRAGRLRVALPSPEARAITVWTTLVVAIPAIAGLALLA